MDVDAVRRALRRRVEHGPGDTAAHPRLVHSHIRAPQAIVLLLHGGEEEGLSVQRTWGVATLPLIPLAERIEHWSHKRLAAVRLINSVTGWNDGIASPLADAQWGIERLRVEFPTAPIGLVGHSMGGRVALSLAADSRVTSVVGLAPWLPEPLPESDFADTPLYVVHGKQDTVTDDDASEELVARVQAAGGDATFQSVNGWHTLLWQARDWQHPVTRFLERTLLD